MRGQQLGRVGVVTATLLIMATGCSGGGGPVEAPGLAARGTTMTTTKPVRQDLDNRLSLTGKVTLNPVFGLPAPVAGEIRYLNVTPPRTAPSRATRVATIRAGGKTHRIEVPAGSAFAGRLVDNRSTVTAGMPVVSAKRGGYGIVADIGGEQAYQISDSVKTVQAQIKNGPGPFSCTVLGTIAALPAGTLPEPEPQTGDSAADGQGPGDKPTAPSGLAASPPQQEDRPEASEATGMRLVCVAPGDIKMINGASVTIQVVTARAKNVLVLPVEAVAGGQGRGKVDIVGPDGNRETRDVVLGLTDGKVVEIRTGLTGDENIAVPGPNLPPGAPADGKDQGGPAVIGK
ncbi:efflux RND transporter periplasmic adaptor subunit [Plantactinospora sp. GCM10030261]|uniref:efflux RND transporter periplasmic adaptor subunit n=1 Tax=Plantactinospora sp. GCM10030261 TaxID=3273420 RepID=UPI003613F6D5